MVDKGVVELGDKTGSEQGDPDIGWRGKEGRGIDRTREERTEVMLDDKGRDGQSRDQRIFGENKDGLC